MKRLPMSPGTVARTALVRTPPGRPSSIGSGTESPVDGKDMSLVRQMPRYISDRAFKRSIQF